MQLRAYWQFYKDIFPFIAAFALLGVAIWGVAIAFVLFLSVGFLVGFIGFNSFKKEQYYFYYNLGITRWKLFKVCFLINIIIGIPIFIILLTFFILFFGRLTII